MKPRPEPSGLLVAFGGAALALSALGLVYAAVWFATAVLT